MTQPETTRGNSPTFGYSPEPDRFDAVGDAGPFERALVIETPVREVTAIARDCRVTWDPPVDLPEGIYWFTGIPDPLIVQVGAGAASGASEVATPADLPDDHPLVNAWNWAEEMWTSAEVVPQPAFDMNDDVVVAPGGIDAQVRGRKYLRREWLYSVRVDGRLADYTETRLSPRPDNDDPAAWIQQSPSSARHFGATLTRAKLQGKFANTLFSFRATRTTFRPYQFKPVLKLLQTGKARLLIADEVGLGKTIEAGLIWTELEARDEANRVLIVCPSSLVGKWKEEMEERFEFELTELTSSGLRDFAIRHRENRLPMRYAYISTIERLRSWSGVEDLKDLPPQFDLVIVDEAHSMRNSGTKNYALGTELAEWADNMVFLTATPINLGQQDLLNLLELLAPEDYGDPEDLELRLEPNRIINDVTRQVGVKGADGHELRRRLDDLASTEFGAAIVRRPDYPLLIELLEKGNLQPRDIVEAKRYLADLNSLATVITRTKKVEVDDRNAKRQEHREDVTWGPDELRFYEEYLGWCQARARAIGMPLYFSMQMPLRLASACLPMARRAVLDPPAFGSLHDADDPQAPKGRIEPHAELVQAALALPEGVDSKFDLLAGVLSDLHGRGKRALLFTHSVPTLLYLEGRLSSRFRVAVLRGSVAREKRRQVMRDFRAGLYDFVFANRVASEGLDFEFCSAVINYDLPWNPMEIEQRIGRIDRIGQREESILIVNFVNEATIDERILSRLLDRIQIFESSIGELEPIITELAPKVLQAGFDFTLTAEQREQKQHEILTAHEEQQAGLRDVSDASSALFVSNDVEVAGLEDELLSTGRYIGQRELAALLDDWARIDGAAGVRHLGDEVSIEFLGNPAMATRIEELARRARRTGAETTTIAAHLRNELPIPLLLDQERARTSGGMLLTATSPLTLAATDVPGHRQARFASLRVSSDSATIGTYGVVLARAAFQSGSGRRTDEIWGSATSLEGGRGDDSPVDALLAALAEGRLEDRDLPASDNLDRLIDRGLNQLYMRHQREQERRTSEFHALQEARLITLEGQHRRKLATIEKRIATSRSRGRGERSIGLFQSQRARATERYERKVDEVRASGAPALSLEPIAVCVVEVVRQDG